MNEEINILAVDDEPINLALIDAAFSKFSHIKIEKASDGYEALDKLKSFDFDVVLLDISMPQMDGIEVLKTIKNSDRLKDIPILMVTANPEKEVEALNHGAIDFIPKPYDVGVLTKRTINYANLSKYTKKIINQNAILEEKVKERTKDIEKALKLAKETEYEISIRLGKASEYRDLETGAHIKRMSYYSEILARLYGLNEDECKLILYAAPLHDIGKVAIPDKILLKPAKFSDEEFEIMKTHTTLGAKILEGAEKYPVLNAGKIIALQHHEKYDGSGYPNGLKGEEIHLYGRITAIADVFDALSSKRCYKPAMELEKVLNIMQKDAGTHFDPHLIEIFIKNLDQFLEIKERFKD